ncbi:hypothetical protein T02_4344 [Trichinella nativa]|uniref:Uncharacterized protein n=1 Tax=Trichinella nativa TaxID=6335 RepID=A0A0V1KQS1_9BILA|nr:hypothetical protein T02_4344 [Trichinella nativa]
MVRDQLRFSSSPSVDSGIEQISSVGQAVTLLPPFVVSTSRAHPCAADTDRANEIFPAENEDEDTEATV